jgi:hypothetical protein
MALDHIVFGHPSAFTRFIACSFDGSTLMAGGIALAPV